MSNLYVFDYIRNKSKKSASDNEVYMFNTHSKDLYKNSKFVITNIVSMYKLELSYDEVLDLLKTHKILGLSLDEFVSNNTIIPINEIEEVHIFKLDDKIIIDIDNYINFDYCCFDYSIDEFKIIGCYLKDKGINFYYDSYNTLGYLYNSINGTRNLKNKLVGKPYLSDIHIILTSHRYLSYGINLRLNKYNSIDNYDVISNFCLDFIPYLKNKSINISVSAVCQNSIRLRLFSSNSRKLISLEDYISKIESGEIF